MNLFIGGRSQGKLDYCRSQHGNENCLILDGGTLPADILENIECGSEEQSSCVLIFNRLHLWVRNCLQERKDPQECFRKFSDRVNEAGLSVDVISDEIGNGIVPNDPFEREWREATGRLLREIAKNAPLVVRIVCGMPQVIKETKRDISKSKGTASAGVHADSRSQGEPSPLVRLDSQSQREPSPLALLYIFRHGTVKGNLEKRFIGITDESLTEDGAAEIRRKKEEGAYPPAEDVQLLFSSPLRRCLETAEIAFPGKEAIPVPDWSEILFGEFEYGNYLELSGDPQYQAWIDSGGEAAFPGGESKAEYCDRVLRGFREVCRRIRECGAGTGKTVTAAASVHLGTMKALLSTMTDLGYFDVQAPNGGGYIRTIYPAAEKITGMETFA